MCQKKLHARAEYQPDLTGDPVNAGSMTLANVHSMMTTRFLKKKMSTTLFLNISVKSQLIITTSRNCKVLMIVNQLSKQVKKFLVGALNIYPQGATALLTKHKHFK